MNYFVTISEITSKIKISIHIGRGMYSLKGRLSRHSDHLCQWPNRASVTPFHGEQLIFRPGFFSPVHLLSPCPNRVFLKGGNDRKTACTLLT